MTKHRGFEVPTPAKYKEYYLISDDFGWFESRTKAGCIDHWRNKVDAVLIKYYIEEGKIALWGKEDYACLECGAVIADVFLHIKYHSSV